MRRDCPDIADGWREEHAAARIAGADLDGDDAKIYALGTITTGVSFVVIELALIAILLRARQARRGSDAGKRLV